MWRVIGVGKWAVDEEKGEEKLRRGAGVRGLWGVRWRCGVRGKGNGIPREAKQGEMPRKSTEESILVKELAAAEGKTVQWARKQRRLGTEVWKKFTETKSRPGEQRAEVVEEDELARARWMARVAFEALTRAEKSARYYERDPGMCVTSARALREARRMYEEAQKHQKRLEIEALQYIPVTKVRDIRAAMSRLSEVVQQFRVRIAGRMPQEMRAAFYAAFEEAKGGWNDGILAVDAYIENLLPC